MILAAFLILIGLALLIAQRLLAGKARTVLDKALMRNRERLLWAVLFVAPTAFME
jgi:hypothetical protein